MIGRLAYPDKIGRVAGSPDITNQRLTVLKNCKSFFISIEVVGFLKLT